MRVLIVEDEPAVALAIEDIAIARGFEIAGIATNMSEALNLGPEADIAVIDVRLGDGLTGPSIARALYAGFGLGVVYLTGNPDFIEQVEDQPVVMKPASPDTIARALSLAAKSARTRTLKDRSGPKR